MEQLCSIRRRLIDANEVNAENLLQNHRAIMREIDRKKDAEKKRNAKQNKGSKSKTHNGKQNDE